MVCFQHFILFLLAGVVLEHTDPPKRKLSNLLISILSMIFIDFHAKDILHGHTEGYIMNTRIRSWECLLRSKHSQLIIHTCTPKFVRCLVSLCHHASTYHLKSLLMWSSFGSVWTGSNIPRIFTYTLTSTSSLKLIHTNTSCLLFAKKSKGHGREGYDFPKECSSQRSVLAKVLLFAK